MDKKECYRFTHPLSKISGYATDRVSLFAARLNDWQWTRRHKQRSLGDVHSVLTLLRVACHHARLAARINLASRKSTTPVVATYRRLTLVESADWCGFSGWLITERTTRVYWRRTTDYRRQGTERNFAESPGDNCMLAAARNALRFHAVGPQSWFYEQTWISGIHGRSATDNRKPQTVRSTLRPAMFRLVRYTRYYFASATVAVDSSHMTASSSASWSRFGSPSDFVHGHLSTIWFMVCRWPQSWEGDWARPHLCKLAR